ncbi:MAG: hypothetical protein NWF01_06560 [Candidatus Bathyarchaeota archaeon]|nr:hypothetical protein [Candidatus Bathyarchaeota archaeon]
MSAHSDHYWVSLAEKFFGFLLLIIGIIMIYFTATTELGQVTWIFALLSIVLLGLGVFLILAKPPE